MTTSTKALPIIITLALLFAFGACSDDNEINNDTVEAASAAVAHDRTTVPDYYTDVRPVIVETCMACHTDEGVGWSMEDPEEAYERHPLIAHMVTSRQMPPWLAEPHVQEYVGDLSLDEDVIEIFAGWRDAGFPRGEPRPDPETRPDPEGVFPADLSLELLPDGSYTPDPSMVDDYRCFVIDWPREEPGYVTGFRLAPGNPRLAHHSIAYVVEPELVDRFRKLEQEEERPGYQCFGDAVPDRLWTDDDEREVYEARYPGGVEELRDGSWLLAQWVTGMWGDVYPEGTGIRVEPGSALAIQMHYYSGDAPGEADAGTQLHFQVAERVERPAFFLLQDRMNWLPVFGPPSLIIPPGDTPTYEVTRDFEFWRSFATDLTGVEEERIEALEVHSAHLHMHAFGQSGEITLVEPDGRSETLLSVPRWDYNWERNFFFTEPKVVPRDEMAATSLRLRCTYHNDTQETVYGGWGAFDEMCMNFSYIAVQEGAPETASTNSGH